MWYNKASQQAKDNFKKQVQTGQFEIANGGWSVNDQACPTFEDMINNIMLGH